jgi:ADP-ribose pyrophosphatase YjhB (NUDIX family)
MATIDFCTRCGKRTELRIPEGDDRPRPVCGGCGFIHYVNPKLVVGCVAEWENRVLLCRRSIEPQYGLWTLPAGYLECGETAADGARREAREEACADVEIIEPYTLIDLTFVDQVYLMFRGRLIDGRFGVGHESLDVRLFDEADVPWDDIAFTAVRETLRFYFRDREAGRFSFHMADITRPDFA